VSDATSEGLEAVAGWAEALFDQMIEQQRQKVLRLAREAVPHISSEDVMNPNDYPELKAHPKAEDIVLEAFEEHHVVDVLMGELEALDVSDETWGAKALVMKENIEHHIGEEEGEMFTAARRVFDREELEDLGQRMEARKAAAGREMGIPVASRS